MNDRITRLTAINDQMESLLIEELRDMPKDDYEKICGYMRGMVSPEVNSVMEFISQLAAYGLANLEAKLEQQNNEKAEGG